MGLMVPMVESAEQARRIVASAKYPPVGRRGVGILYRDDWVEGSVAATMERVNRELLLIAQVETAAGVEHAEEIGAVDGIDVLWIGHYDLTASLGIPGQFEHGDYLDAVERVLEAARATGKALGITAPEGTVPRPEPLEPAGAGLRSAAIVAGGETPPDHGSRR